MEWCPLTGPFHVAKAHLDKGTPTTHIQISPLFSTYRPLTPKELDPPCFQCHLGEGDSADPNLIQRDERCLKWIHTYCLPQPIRTAHAILKEGWTCHECELPSISQPCPHHLCTIQFTPTLHKASDIRKLQGGKLALTKFLEAQRTPTSQVITPCKTKQYSQSKHTPKLTYTYRPQRNPQ